MKDIVNTLRGSARPETEQKPMDAEKEKEKEEQRIRDLTKASDDQDRTDWDNQRDRKLALEEKLKQDMDNAAQAKLNEQQRVQEEQMKALNTQELNECRFSEQAPPWTTDLTNDQMGSITAW
eukprot:876772-Heterocapsa_arctica.AAC.1